VFNCPPVHLTTLVCTKEDVREFMNHRIEYTKANAYKDVIMEIYI